jgi:hypothetical protein
VAACEPATRRGPTRSLERQVHQLERALARCQRECQRQAALVRATQRAVGLPVTPEPNAAGTKGSQPKRSRKGKADRSKLRRRRQAPRAVRAARCLQKAVAQSEALEVQPTSESPSQEEGRCLGEEPRHDSSRT